MSHILRSPQAIQLLITVLIFAGVLGYFHYDKNRMKLDAECGVVMVTDKTVGHKLVANDTFIGFAYVNVLALKLDDREWTEEVDHYTYNSIKVKNWVKRCLGGENNFPRFEKI